MESMKVSFNRWARIDTCISIVPSIRTDSTVPDDMPMRIYASDTKAFFHKFYRMEDIGRRNTVNEQLNIYI